MIGTSDGVKLNSKEYCDNYDRIFGKKNKENSNLGKLETGRRKHKSKYENEMPDYLLKKLGEVKVKWEEYLSTYDDYRSLYTPWHQDFLKKQRKKG